MNSHHHLARLEQAGSPLCFDEYSLDEARTAFATHVESGVPCVIRNGVQDWPAMARWSRLDYWMKVARDVPVTVCRSIQRTVVPDHEKWKAPDAIKGFEEPGYHVVLFPIDHSPQPAQPNAFDVVGDLGPFSFGPSWISASSVDFRGPIFYEPFRVFLYRQSYTDWHHHGADDSLTVQIAGRKRFAMLPPTLRSWQFRARVLLKEHHLDPAYAQEGFEDIRPFVADLDPGDVIFIPPYWQHAAESINDENFGATLVCTYATPAHRAAPPSAE